MVMKKLPLFSDYSFQLPSFDVENLSMSNGIKLNCFPDRDSEVVRLEFMFSDAGSNNQKKFFSASAAANMLTEGSGDLTGVQMADKLDYYAAYVEKTVDRESCSIVFYFLTKYSFDLLPLIEMIIKQPRYSEEEFEIYRNKQKQSFLLNNQKTNMIAYKKFYNSIFPASNPFGKFGKLEDYDCLTRDDVRNFYDEFYSFEDCEISVAGNYSDDFVVKLVDGFGSEKWGKGKDRTTKSYYDTNYPMAQTIFEHKENAVQASIRLGNLTINHMDEDYHSFKVLVALFGGYFGSRLMTNIREEKGYTYSIGSYITSYRDCSVLSTTADVKAEKAMSAIDEIGLEIKKLHNDLVSEQELIVLKNYLLGDCLRGLDGVFDVAEKFSFIRKYNLPLSYFNDIQNTILEIKPEDLRNLAQKYLDFEKMTKVIVCDRTLLE